MTTTRDESLCIPPVQIPWDARKIPLKWKDNSTNEDKFRIERKPSNNTAWAILHEVSANTTGYIDNNSVTAGTHYDYRVQACVKDICSVIE